MVQRVKHLPAMRETRVQSPGGEDPLEKEMATHPSTLLLLENPTGGEPWYMGSQRVGHDCHGDPFLGSASLGLSAFCPLTTAPTLRGDRPTQVSTGSFLPLFHTFGGF